MCIRDRTVGKNLGALDDHLVRVAVPVVAGLGEDGDGSLGNSAAVFIGHNLAHEAVSYTHLGSSAWSDLQAYLTSTVSVDYNGGATNLSAIRNLAYDPDPAVRKAAYEAELACYDKIKDPVAFALNSIKLETIYAAQLRGYESPLDKALKDARMQRATLDAMFAAIDEYLPKFWARCV